MSRFLLATLGSLGDLHPYIAVGRALRDRGHSAVIATSADYQQAIEGAGLEFAPVRPRLDSLGDLATFTRRLFHPLLGPERLIREFVMANLRDAHADLTRAAMGADLLVSHPLTVALPLIAEQTRRPWVSTLLAPMSFMSRHDPPYLAGLNLLRTAHRFGPVPCSAAFRLTRWIAGRWEAPLQQLRSELGLPRTDKPALFEGQFSPWCTLALFDPLLASPQPDWPANTRVCGAPMFDGSTPDPSLLQDLASFLGEGDPPLVFALGSSAVWMAGRYWQHAVDAAQALGRRAILLTGYADLPDLPATIRAYPYLPYSRVFAHAAAVIHQAGIGTLSQALRAGRPQLITPVAFDQPDNAARAARLGVARVVPFARITAAKLRTEIAALLATAAYEHKARDLAARLRADDGAARAAEQLIAVAQRVEPAAALM